MRTDTHLKRTLSMASRESVEVFKAVAAGRALRADVVLSVNRSGNIVAEVMDGLWLKHEVEFSKTIHDLHEVFTGGGEITEAPAGSYELKELLKLLFIS